MCARTASLIPVLRSVRGLLRALRRLLRRPGGLLRALFRLPVRDIDSVKLYRAEDLRLNAPRSRSDFLEAEILIRLCRAGRVVREVDVPHLPRTAGRARGVTLRSAVLAAAALLAFALREFDAHMRLAFLRRARP